MSKLTESKKFRKAYTAAAVALTTCIGTALLAGTITGTALAAAFGAALLAGAAVYRVKNAD